MATQSTCGVPSSRFAHHLNICIECHADCTVPRLYTLRHIGLLFYRGLEAYEAPSGAALQQPFPGSSDNILTRPKPTRRTYIPRADGDDDYDGPDGKNGARKRRYRVAEVRGSWTPEEDATLMT